MRILIFRPRLNAKKRKNLTNAIFSEFTVLHYVRIWDIWHELMHLTVGLMHVLTVPVSGPRRSRAAKSPSFSDSWKNIVVCELFMLHADILIQTIQTLQKNI